MAEDARQSLTEHVAEKGLVARQKYGPRIGWEQMQCLLQDRSLVRYPCRIIFTGEGLRPGEFACPVPLGERPEDGYEMRVHPAYRGRPEIVPLLVLYQLVEVNYGGFASAEDAETFGAAALGMDKEEYYQTLCRLSDELDPPPACQAGGGA